MRTRSEKRSGHATEPRKTAKQQLRQRRRFGGARVRILSRISPDQGISLHQQKSPTRQLGANGMALSREERAPLRHGRGAWLTSFQPITVAAPPPEPTSSPPSPSSHLLIFWLPRPPRCRFL